MGCSTFLKGSKALIQTHVTKRGVYSAPYQVTCVFKCSLRTGCLIPASLTKERRVSRQISFVAYDHIFVLLSVFFFSTDFVHMFMLVLLSGFVYMHIYNMGDGVRQCYSA